MVRIISGLEEGEVVLMTPPLKAATIEPGSQLEGTGSPDALGDSEILRQRVNQKLEEANGTGFGMPSDNIGGPLQQEQGRPMGSGRGEFGREQMGRERTQIPSPEQMEEMRKRFENMSPEEREKMRQRFQGTGSGQREGQRQGASQRPRGSERNQ